MQLNNSKSKAVSLFLLLLVVILGTVLTYISTTQKNKVVIVSNNGGSTDPKLRGPESEGIKEDQMKDWKTYTDPDSRFSIKYPEGIEVSSLPKYELSPEVTLESKYGLKIYVQLRIDPKNFWGTPILKVEDSFMAAVDPVFYKHQGYSAVKFNDDSLIVDAKATGRTELGRNITILKSNELWNLDGYYSINRLDDYKLVDQIFSTFEFVDVGMKINGTITSIKNDCNFDGVCEIQVDGRSIIVDLGGDPSPEISLARGYQGITSTGLLNADSVGRKVEAYVGEDSGKYTLYGNKNYYIKFVDD